MLLLRPPRHRRRGRRSRAGVYPPGHREPPGGSSYRAWCRWSPGAGSRCGRSLTALGPPAERRRFMGARPDRGWYAGASPSRSPGSKEPGRTGRIRGVGHMPPGSRVVTSRRARAHLVARGHGESGALGRGDPEAQGPGVIGEDRCRGALTAFPPKCCLPGRAMRRPPTGDPPPAMVAGPVLCRSRT